MYKISLINMPFASLGLPSIALTQLRAVVEQRFGERVRVRVLYLNQDFARYFGLSLYTAVASALEASNSGLGDWLFRQAAFPDLADNARDYFQRYFPTLDAAGETMKGAALAKRTGLRRFLERLADHYQLDGEDLVGFTSMFAQNLASLAMARLLKSRRPAIVTVLGGANCEAPMGRELAARCSAVDFVFSGPALVSFPELLACELAGEAEARHRIPGVYSRHNTASPHLAGSGMIGAELPIDVPVPLDYETFLADLSHNFPGGEVSPALTFETSRGCWWGERSHCTFCGLNGSTMRYRALPAAQALTLLEGLFRRYADRCDRFESVDNIMPREYLTEVFPHLQTPPGVGLFYEVKADLKESEMEVLGRAGVTVIQPGIEALATSTLKLMRKGTTSFQNIAFLKSCVRFGIDPIWNLLIGFPGEDEDVYRKYLRDLPLLFHLPPPAGAFPVRFDRYSPYFTRSAEYGLELAPYDFYRAIYPFPEEALQNLAYYFEDRRYDASYIASLAAWQGTLAAAVARWRERWQAADGRGLKAELSLIPQENGALVRDTRSGELVEHQLGELALKILADLRLRPLGLPHLVERLGVETAAVEAELAALRSNCLLFEEGERFLSLSIGQEL